MVIAMDFLDDTDKLVLSLINKGMNIGDISSLLKLSYAGVHHHVVKLKLHGFHIVEKYYDNGTISYNLMKNTGLANKYKNTIITRPEDSEFSFLLTSDYHLGSLYETPKLIEQIYNFCMQKDIHIVLNTGDLLEGIVNLQNIKIAWDEQIYHALEEYPQCDNILTFMLFGNHDHSLLLNYGLDIRKVIEYNFSNIITLGYGNSKVNIKNDEIILSHPLDSNKNSHGQYTNKIILRGHGHEAKVICDGNNYVIKLPSLSNLNFNKSSFPGACLMHLKMSKGNITFITIEELTYINNKFYTTSEIKLSTGRGKSYHDNTVILNEEDYPKLVKRL